ncbi:homoserine O-acetyltransferase MetA [Nitratireductor indicus]|uniref:homoserine O-acetyltransferase MetA n=1 Tax=Nitratireductor indicus TaxID=721133 RepID=UPI0028741A60|nr:homoserine O-succinyltransferase [Nitratireductor indicus]MDS1136351.1 homoserine O-succinyltransferase [Nitratireductor indicus]
MPIKIPDQLPAHDVLVREGVSVMDERTALRQDVRPLQIGLLNLMPNKIRTETQFARLLGATPLQVELTLVRIGNHKPKNTSEEHLIAFYQTWEEVRARKFDGFIITGAPVELLPYEEVTYWEELEQIFDWTATNVHSSNFICWGAMAAAWHFHRIPKHTLEKKAFGVYRHRNNNPASPYLAGFSDDFAIPVSRWTEVRAADVPADSSLEVLMESDDVGLCLLTEQVGNRLYMFNHIEYDSTSLKEEYDRDVSTGVPVDMPHEYFPKDDPARPPLNRWRSHAHLLFGNWINQVYQTTPYELDMIGEGR